MCLPMMIEAEPIVFFLLSVICTAHCFLFSCQRSGYEVYILEATYKDPAGCAARNVHGFTLDDIERMAGQWEEAPTLYLQLDIKTLFHGDDLKESGIKEVEMDMDEDSDGLLAQQEKETNSIAVSITGEDPPAGMRRDGMLKGTVQRK